MRKLFEIFRLWSIVGAVALISLPAAALINQDNLFPTIGSDSGIDGAVNVPPSDGSTTDQSVPQAPEISIRSKTTRNIVLEVYDHSDIETGFTLYRKETGGDWKELGTFPAIENRSASYFVLDGPEPGFEAGPAFNGARIEESVTVSVPTSAKALTSFSGEVGPDTNYCYKLIPFNDSGEPQGVKSVCARTNVDLKQVSRRDEITLSDEITVHPLVGTKVSLKEYDSATLVKDEEGLVGELYARYTGSKLVYIADNATLDLSAYSRIPLKTAITLMSGRGKLERGALLFTRQVLQTGNPLFDVKGNRVTVKGIRFSGPEGDAGTDSFRDEHRSKCIRFNFGKISDQITASNPVSLLIENNEFFNWPGAGVAIDNKVMSLPDGSKMVDFDTAERIRIVGNYFHHNQQQNAGYGVEIAGATYALIEQNTFDYNRHTIGSTGGRKVIIDGYGPQHGYKAYLNLVLPGHSDQCYVGVCFRDTHHFDVHGSESSTLGVGYYDGWAGEYIDLAYNSFLGISGEGKAFNVRGTPSQAAEFRGNILPPVYLSNGRFSYNAKYAALWVNEESDRDNIYIKNNQLVDDPRAELGAGDFDGDGITDVFLASGAAWYYSSGGRTEWRFLKKSSYTMSELAIADYDNDGVADILRKRRNYWLVSKGGLGPWTRDDITNATDFSTIESSGGSELTGDFTGDGSIDQLLFDREGDRFFYVNGNRHSRHRM